MRRAALVALSVTALLAACGGEDDETSGDVTTTATQEASAPAATTTVVAETTTAETDPVDTTTAPSDTPAAETTTPSDSAPAAGGAVAIDLAEWTLTASAPVAAGTTEFAVTNSGEFPHKFGVIQGDSYATLPQTENGAVDEAALPAGALIGETETLDPGGSTTISLDLPAGNYVFICNIAVGPNSHAKAGQTLDVTVG
jgi:hypothetical protein